MNGTRERELTCCFPATGLLDPEDPKKNGDYGNGVAAGHNQAKKPGTAEFIIAVENRRSIKVLEL